MEHAIHFILMGGRAACGKRSVLSAGSMMASAKFATKKPAEVTCRPCAKYAAGLVAFSSRMAAR